ncbi:ABC transporter ATP-binding protein [Clostridium butyricum]|uniref:ABC-type multidrug/protein/lipid transport system, ATPase component n=1 Tax=Clostridium butyricum E4 str. BoNT E BL5262 TaxID=632245 RepID=C4ICL9_CLOBU|nr:ABC transporter ATP-binding protein [Clostridium butyricum]EDT76445.1 ABC-type multidrug/protein/lipid transport system, ATPase component [Clostridium butyricum 5521]EEP56408.1 ABC-type multidrug/protein/lipid transport system, ATPase component [Clostridium butyricum E4 str. BoNT E BL5262]NFL32699.1 ABC transporter ATP-binding protein [Clostridium butyricum]NFS20086.1 ABC transporter ATP-binding protein [Clostridium butyricum]
MIKTLMSQVKQYKKDSILCPIFVILEVIMEVIIPFLMASIIDKGVEAGNMMHVIKIGTIMIIMAMMSLTFGALAGKYAASASTGFAKNLRKTMFQNIQSFSFSNIDKYSTAGLVTRLTTDITNVQNAYQMVVRLCTRAPIMLICAMFMAFKINSRLSMVFLGAALFLGVSLYLITKNVHPLFMKVFKKYDALNASVQENINAVRVVKAYVREEYEINKFHTACENIYKLFVNAEKILVLNMPIMQFAVYTCILLVSWIGAKMIVGGSLTTGELMSLFTYIMNIMISLMMISMIFVMVIMSKASAERIVEVINEKSDLNNKENPVYEVKDGSIAFENVNFLYKKDGEKVLSNINLNIESGQTIGVIGGTGSAKSSLVQLIPRLYDTESGQVKVGGLNVKEYDIETLRNEVAMVLQKNVLFSGTIKDNLKWGNKEATDEEIRKACILAQADEFIQTFPDKYDTFIEQGGSNVSGGQKQRLCIARALLKKPKILILDDSTSAVDTKTDTLIRRAFKDEIPNTTKIIIAQRISSVQDSDNIIVLNEGTIVDFGNHDELVERCEIYRDVYESQMKGADKDEEK